MKNWTRFFSSRENVVRLNGSLSNALDHCPPLEVGGWKFRCVECHISTGAYPAGFSGPPLSRSEYQIHVALSGSFDFQSPQAKGTRIRSGGALVIPGKLPHRWTCLESGVLIGMSLQFMPTPESMLQDGRLIDGMVSVPGNPLKEKALKLISSGLEERDPALHSTITACHLFLLLAAILRQISPRQRAVRVASNKIASTMRGREIVAWIMRYVDENLEAGMTHDKIAKDAGISGRQLHRLFFKHVGKSFHDYLLGRRLEEAQRQLARKGQKKSIKEIAFACGFGSLSYFSTSFRKIYGISPSRMGLPDAPATPSEAARDGSPPRVRAGQRKAGSPRLHPRF